MGRQTGRPSFRAVRRRKYIARRIMVLILLAGVIVGLVFLTKALFAGKVTPNGGATPTPELSENPAEPTPTPKPTPTPELDAALTVTEQSADALSQIGFHSEIFVRRDQTAAYTREENIYFGRGDKYSDLKGVITYGGNNFRSSFAYGGVNALSGQLTTAWEKSIGQLDCGTDGVWTGTGWTGQRPYLWGFGWSCPCSAQRNISCRPSRGISLP